MKRRDAPGGHRRAERNKAMNNRQSSLADAVQRRGIETILDRNILVEAAAGTGKTTMIVRRMVALIRSGAGAIDAMAALTFTRKAAAELRSRFQSALVHESRSAAGEESRRLKAALERFDSGFVGTIHSFCARLLRERPVEAQVEVGFSELDEDEDTRLRHQAWDECLADLYALGDPLTIELPQNYLGLDDLKDAYLSYTSHQDVEDWPSPSVSVPDTAPVLRELPSFLDRLRRITALFPVIKEQDHLLSKAERILRMAKQADLSRPAELAELLQDIKSLDRRDIVVKSWKGIADEKEELRAWNDFAELVAAPYMESWRSYLYRPAMDVIRRAAAHYDQLRRSQGGLSFQDLLKLTAALLRDKAGVRRYFRSRYRHLLVDEFQDTDPLQAEIILYLTAADASQGNWRLCRPVPGSLFVVGDPKQSIYRFRRADIVAYGAVKEIITAGGGLALTLSTNFRATPAGIRWINDAFCGRFPAQASSVSPAYVAMSPPPGAADADQAPVLRLDLPDTLSDQESLAVHEAGVIARYLRGLIDQGSAQPSDVLILTRFNKRLSIYSRALDEAGLPHQVTGGSALNELEELGLLRLCLGALSRPHDPIRLAAVLRSGLFGFSDRDLWLYRQGGGQFSFTAPLPPGLPGDVAAVFGDAFERLKRYNSWFYRLPAAAAMENVIADLGLAALASARGGGAAGGGFMKALEILRRDGEAGWSLSEAAGFLDRLCAGEARHDCMPAAPPRRAVIRIMNLHQAKGLEAPLVFLADPSGGKTRPIAVAIDRGEVRPQGYLAVFRKQSWSLGPLLAHPACWGEAAAREAAFNEAEQDRLLYVAATRAKKRTVISVRAKKKGESPWLPLENHLSDCPPLTDPGPTKPTPTSLASAAACPDFAAARSSASRRLRLCLKPTYAVAAAKSYALDGASWATDHGGEAGAGWGSVIHALMQTAMLSPEAALEPLAAALLAEQGLNTSLAGAAVELVAHVASSGLWRRALAASRRLVEVPFYSMTAPEAPGDPPTLLRGIIDLVFWDSAPGAQGWVVVDYKTDRLHEVDADAVTARYLRQARLYAEHWAKLTGMPVKEAWLFFVSEDKAVLVT